MKNPESNTTQERAPKSAGQIEALLNSFTERINDGKVTEELLPGVQKRIDELKAELMAARAIEAASKVAEAELTEEARAVRNAEKLIGGTKVALDVLTANLQTLRMLRLDPKTPADLTAKIREITPKLEQMIESQKAETEKGFGTGALFTNGDPEKKGVAKLK